MCTTSILEEMDIDPSVHQNQIKISFLQKQKQRLEKLVYQLTLNNKALKEVADQYQNSKNDSINKLIQTNQRIKQEKADLFQKQMQTVKQCFVIKQTIGQNHQQLDNFCLNYEIKTALLREYVQKKESYMQKIQSKYHLQKKFDEKPVLPYEVSDIFNPQFQQYKAIMSSLKKNNELLTVLNQRLAKKIKSLRNKTNKLESSLQSRHSFLQLKKQIQDEQTLSISEIEVNQSNISKQLVEYGGKKSKSYSNVPNSAKNISCSSLPVWKQTLTKKHLEVKALRKRYKVLKCEYEQVVKLQQSLSESYKIHISQNNEIKKQLLKERKKVQNLLQSFSYRRSSPFCNIQKIAEPFQIEKINIPDKKRNLQNYWIDISKNIACKLSQFSTNSRKKIIKRSLSCEIEQKNMTNQYKLMKSNLGYFSEKNEKKSALNLIKNKFFLKMQ